MPFILKRAPGVGGLPEIPALSAGPFTSAMTFLDGQVASGQGVQLGSVTTQTNVLTSYPSGAVKHALVSWVIPSAASYALSAITNPGGSFSPTNPSASVAFVIGADTFTATLPAFDSAKTRVNGAVMRECRYIVIPANGGTPHPFLGVVFDIRSYAAGGHRVDVCVGSTRDNVNCNTCTADVTVTINGSASYTRTAMEMGSFMRWRHVGYVSLTEGSITHDTSALETLKAVPTFISTTATGSYTFTLNIDSFTDGGRGYDKLRTGIVEPNFGNTGGREDIGLFTRWQCIYLKHKTTNALECTTRHGDLFGSQSVHITADSGDPEALIDIDVVPGWSTQNASPNGPLNGSVGVGMSTCVTAPDSAHQPGVTFLPWVLTGDRYYADELAFWANWNMLHQPSGMQANARQGAEGLMVNDQQRGWAWGCRTMGQAGKWLPDAHPFKAYFAEKTQNNLDWANDYATGWYTNGYGGGDHPLGFVGQPAADQNNIWNQGNTDGLDAPKLAILHAAGYTNLSLMVIFAPWQYAFMSTVTVCLYHLGYTGATNKLDSLVGVIRNLFTHDPDLPFNHAAMFFPPCAYNTSVGTTVLLPNWGGANSIHELSALWRGDQDPATESGGCPTFSIYGPEVRTPLMIGKARGLDNDDIIDDLMAYVHPVTSLTMVTNVNNRPEWCFTQEFLNH